LTFEAIKLDGEREAESGGISLNRYIPRRKFKPIHNSGDCQVTWTSEKPRQDESRQDGGMVGYTLSIKPK
jgi:hypothetical protein